MAAPSFLSGLPKSGTAPALVNERTGAVVAETVEVAATSESRRRGLLGRDALDPAYALVIAPCSAIHMFFMRIAIDAIFVDRDGRIRKIVRGLRPWRIAASLGWYAVIEMKSGSADAKALAVGDCLRVRG